MERANPGDSLAAGTRVVEPGGRVQELLVDLAHAPSEDPDSAT
jgi:hypothetical protein